MDTNRKYWVKSLEQGAEMPIFRLIALEPFAWTCRAPGSFEIHICPERHFNRLCRRRVACLGAKARETFRQHRLRCTVSGARSEYGARQT